MLTTAQKRGTPPKIWRQNVYLLIRNRHFETAVGNSGHTGAIARQRRADKQGSVSDGCPRIPRAVASRVRPGVVVAAEIGQRIACSGDDRIDMDRDGLPRRCRDVQACRGLCAALDTIGQVDHGAAWRDGDTLEIGQVLIERPELQGAGPADLDRIDEGHPHRDGFWIRVHKTGQEQQPRDGDCHGQYSAIAGLSKPTHKYLFFAMTCESPAKSSEADESSRRLVLAESVSNRRVSGVGTLAL